MSEDLKIQQGPSATPYILGGGGLGAVAGLGATRYIDPVKNFVTEAPKYKSHEDLVNEAKDDFQKVITEVESHEVDDKSFVDKLKAEKANVDKAGAEWEASKAEYIKNGQKEVAAVDTDEIKELNKQLEELQEAVKAGEKTTKTTRKVTERLSKQEDINRQLVKLETDNKARKKVFEMQETIEKLKNNKNAVEQNATFRVSIPESTKYAEDLYRFTEPVDPKYLTKNGKQVDVEAARKSIKNKIQALRNAETELNTLIDTEATKLSKVSTKGDGIKIATANSENEIKKFIDNLQGLTKQQKADILAEAKIELGSRSGAMGHLQSWEARLQEATAQYNRLTEATRGKFEGKNAETMGKLIAKNDAKIAELNQAKTLQANRRKHVQQMWDARKASRNLENKKVIDLTVGDITKGKDFKYTSFTDTLTDAEKTVFKKYNKMPKATTKVEEVLVKALPEEQLKAKKAQISELTSQIAKKRDALPKQAVKSVEELTAEFVKEKGTKADTVKNATKNALENVKEEFGTWVEKATKTNTGKVAIAAVGAAVIGAAIGLMLKPSKKEA